MSADDLFDEANQNGISKSTLKRAKKELKIRSRKREVKGGWEWELQSRAKRTVRES